MISRDEFAKFLFALRKVVPTYAPDLDDETVTLWHQAFSHCTLEELRTIYVFVRDNERNFPSIVRLRQLLERAQGGQFETLIDLIAKHGTYQPPMVADLLARVINRLGGWKKICEWTNDELPFRRKDFEATYEELSTLLKMGQLDTAHPAVLQGEHTTASAYQISSPAKLEIAPSPPEPSLEEKTAVKTQWQKIVEKFGDDINPHIPEHLRARGFFKLKSTPGYYFRYRSTDDPLAATWPYKFVDVDEHRDAMKRSAEMKSSYAAGASGFDSSRYTADRYRE